MALPEISLPFLSTLSTPFHLHPVFVYFAVSLPIVILLLEVFNIFARRRVIDILTSALIALLVVIFAFAYVSGVVDSKQALSSMLDDAAKDALKSHQILGTYITAIGISLVVIFKAVSLFVNKT